MREAKETSQLIDFLGGFFGGVVSTYVGHPLDTVKVRMQTQSKSNPIYRGAFHCFTTIYRQEKIRGLYKGVTSPLLGIAGMNATLFTVSGAAMNILKEDKPINHWWAGCIAGLAQCIIISPVEMIKTQMQIQGIGKAVGKEYRGWGSTVKHIYHYGGISNGFLKGMTTCVVRDVPSFGAFFYTYELLVGKPNWLNYHGNYGIRSLEEFEDLFKIIFAGGMAGVNSWVISYPADVVKTRIQAQHMDQSPVYKRSFHGYECFVKGYKSEGWRFCWHGVVPTCVRAFPSNAAVFLVWQFFTDTFT